MTKKQALEELTEFIFWVDVLSWSRSGCSCFYL